MDNSDNNLWFFYDLHTTAGRPKMEDALMDYAKEAYLHGLVVEDDFAQILFDLEDRQREILESNKRLRRVEVRLIYNPYYSDAADLRIGEQYLRLRKVRKVIRLSK